MSTRAKSTLSFFERARIEKRTTDRIIYSLPCALSVVHPAAAVARRRRQQQQQQHVGRGVGRAWCRQGSGLSPIPRVCHQRQAASPKVSRSVRKTLLGCWDGEVVRSHKPPLQLAVGLRVDRIDLQVLMDRLL